MVTSTARLARVGGLASLVSSACVLSTGGTATDGAGATATTATTSTTTTTGAGGATTTTTGAGGSGGSSAGGHGGATTTTTTTGAGGSGGSSAGGHGGAGGSSAGGHGGAGGSSAGGHGGATTTTGAGGAAGAGGAGGGACGAGAITCDGACVDPLTDDDHCGASGDCAGANAGVACTAPAVCKAGACTDPCSPLATCGGACVDTQTAPKHCGACGFACPGAANAVGVCSKGTCGLACTFGWSDANASAADGCESTSLLLWLDASTLALADGAAVATWPDASGHARDATQANPSEQPTFVADAGDGRRAVRFDGTKDHLVTPTFQLFASASGGLTIAVVFRADELAAQGFLLQNPQTYCTNNLELGYRTGTKDRANFGIHAGCTHATVTTTSIAKSTWMTRVVTVLPQGSAPANVTVHDDAGVSLPMEKDSNGWVAAGSYGTKVRKLVVGGRDANNDGKYDSLHKGDIAEIQVHGAALDDAARAALLAYLAAKWP